MQGRPQAKDVWLTEPAPRGHGRFMARITPAGERLFYFRYTRADGQRDTLLIGPYSATAKAGAFTVEQARDTAARWREMYRGGIADLRKHFEAERAAHSLRAELARAEAAAALQQQREAEAAAELERQRRLTLRQLFERWASTELTPRRRADGTRTGRKDGGAFTRGVFDRWVFPGLGDRAAADLRKADFMMILDAAKAQGKLRTCNVLLAEIKQMLRFAVTREIIPINPLEGVTKRDAGGTETSRERVLAPTELQALAEKLPRSTLSKRSELAVSIILGTMCRAGELMGAVWALPGLNVNALAEQADAAGAKFGLVDLERRTWHLPTTKNERPHTIHLSEFTVCHLLQLWQLRELGVPWLYPNSDSTGPVDVKTFGKQLADRQRPAERRLRGRASATDALVLPGGTWTAHDLRRTSASLMAALGISGDVIDECLNHVIESRVRRTYIRDRRPLQQAQAFDALGCRLQELMEGAAPVSNVVTLGALREAA
jgi:integrase